MSECAVLQGCVGWLQAGSSQAVSVQRFMFTYDDPVQSSKLATDPDCAWQPIPTMLQPSLLHSNWSGKF